ncbi:response regulator [Pseudomonadota bacterium]
MSKKRILVVDDDNISRTILYGFLKNEDNYIVETVKSGRDCLNFIKLNNVDLIISDVVMDNIDGLELIETLLSKEETSKIPVILSSIKDESEIIRKSRNYSNVRKVVQKPYDRNLLVSDLKEIFAV